MRNTVIPLNNRKRLQSRKNIVMQKSIILIFSLLVGSFNLIAQDLYDISNLTIIELTFDDPNWDETMDTHYANDMDERLMASCTINGIAFDSVGVKYKGNSTYDVNSAKNPLNIKLDYILNNQDYDGWYTLKLSNGNRDPSFIREALSYEILRKYMMAPLSNFAKVFINGNYYGLFTSNESINKKFVEDYFYADGENTLVKADAENLMNGSSSLEFLGLDSTIYYPFYDVKSDYGWEDLADFINDLNNDFSNAEQFMNIDRAIWMLAFNNVMVNLDSYSGPFQQNYYLFKDDYDRMNAIMWDFNMNFGAFTLLEFGPGGFLSTQGLQELDPLLRMGDTSFPLINKILNNDRYRKMYIAHCRTILEENIENDLYFDRAESMQDLIYDDFDSDPGQFFSTTDFVNNLTTTIPGSGGPGGGSFIGLSELMDARLTYLQAHTEFQKVPPSIDNIATSSVIPNTTVDITVEVNNSNYVYLGYRNSVAEPFSKIEMFDDGAHNDGAAGDGTYGVSITVGTADIQYYIYAENDDAGIFSPQRAEHEYHEFGVVGDVVINEFLASNSSTQADQNGEYDDWIELYNNTPNTIDLSGYYLSDNGGNPTKWTFPNGTFIEANDYLIVWADKDTTQAGLHANFKLSADGEALYLSNSSGSLIDEIVFPVQTTDQTYGRYPNGTGTFTFMTSTFNAENSIGSTVSVIEASNTLKAVSIYPNPVREEFVVNFNSNEKLLLVVYNSMGAIIYREHVINGSVINTSRWSNGYYFLKIGNGHFSKLIKH